jgi:hypothetical protein
MIPEIINENVNVYPENGTIEIYNSSIYIDKDNVARIDEKTDQVRYVFKDFTFIFDKGVYLCNPRNLENSYFKTLFNTRFENCKFLTFDTEKDIFAINYNQVEIDMCSFKKLDQNTNPNQYFGKNKLKLMDVKIEGNPVFIKSINIKQ